MIITKTDKNFLILLLIIAIIGIITSINKCNYIRCINVAQIFVGGEYVKTISLKNNIHEEFCLRYKNNYNIIEVINNQIRVREANCADQICVKTGWLCVAPQQIVCLPFRMVIKIISEGMTDIDDITR